MAHFLLRLSTLIAAFVALAGPTLAQVSEQPAAASRAASWAPDLTFVVDGGEDGPVEAGAWLPPPAVDGRHAPLIVFSHGNGGEYRGHADTARALAEAGFVVAALTHPRDNYRDLSRSTQLTARAPQLSRLIDHMTGERFARVSPIAVDAGRIGAFGFSAGGFTVTSAIGGVSDLEQIADHCVDQADDFACRLIALQPIDSATWRPDARDDRIKAAVIAAPALGFSFTTDSLARIRIPVQLWRAEDDQILPSPYNVEPIRDRLPAATEYRVVEGAGHYDFLPPCSPALAEAAPAICAPTPGFDRAAFHETFNRDVVSFFKEQL
ncbi:dienelactone hydrolase [Brevundimonas sp.]|uniref:alpha/beta hydrolase family protein n=1 Tax=Brevundimonas sp. TaxID=1871086 RepID=UPI001AC541D6|nr:dienelactone hydrolase [Brevundimonas sp.]MBN9466019.1 dienelactone hydrolase [Brevundimonas sp.]